MDTLFSVALAPILIIIIYVYIRDKYEKEPIRLLLLGTIFGVFITFPIISIQMLLTVLMPRGGLLTEAAYTAFIVASSTEEFFKYIVLFFLVWKNRNFNEKFDGIVYAVFISLGFAGIENVLYVFNPSLGGMQTAIARAFFSVPGHALFGVSMGYYFALAKFDSTHERSLLRKAFLVPWILHGTYNFILMSRKSYIMVFFIPFVLYMWVNGFRKMKRHIQDSPFKPEDSI